MEGGPPLKESKSKTSDPPETDLDYYSRPENYGGSNLTNIKRFNFAKQKEEKEKLAAQKTKKKKSDGFDLFKRYRHILQGYLDADIESEDSDTSEDEDEDNKNSEESQSKKIKFIATVAEETVEEKGKTPEVASENEGNKSKQSKTHETVKIKSECQNVQNTPPPEVCLSPTPSWKSPDTRPDSGYRTGKDGSMSDSPDSTRSRISSIAMTKSAQIMNELRKETARNRWKKYARLITMVHKLTAAASQGGNTSSMKTFMDIGSEAETSAMKNSGLSFDPNYFKAKKEINISNEVKHILSLPSEERTPEQIQTAMFGLQSLRSFAEYPLHMQEKLATVAWYEQVPPKRIIIRQGHFAENFYFILSGQAVVSLLLKDPKTGASFVKTATIMRKGMSFGELALLHHSRRTATVTSQGAVQLLTIGREDFFDIFMSGQGPDDIPEHIKFITQCDFMKGFPIEHLLEHPEQCLLHFFKRNVVIVKDSTFNEWIYVVKSGFCQVLKQLRGVTPKLGYNKENNKKMDSKIPKLAGFVHAPKVDTGLRKQGVQQFSNIEENNEDSPVSDEELDRVEVEPEVLSKNIYSKFPATRKAHFSRKRQMNYVVPEKCRPPKPPEEPKETPTAKLPPVFVQVEALKPRDAFGLETIQFDDDIESSQTSVSLVSRGAECIMLSKEFFIKHANEQVKRLIRQHVQPYPAEETFQDNLQIKADWQLYKHSLLATLTSKI